MKPYRDRRHAGRKLAEALRRIEWVDPIVVALPRGGVPVGIEIAKTLHAPLDLLVVRKLGLPGQPELAMGAIAEGCPGLEVINTSIIGAAGVGAGEIAEVYQQEAEELCRRINQYEGVRPRIDAAGRDVIVVDDGIATGATMRAALRAVRLRHPRSITLAIPVGAAQAIGAMRPEVDGIVCPLVSESFGGVGEFYDEFDQVTDAEVSDAFADLTHFPGQ